MNEEIKNFFVRNGGGHNSLWVDDYCFSYFPKATHLEIISKYEDFMSIDVPPLDRLKALIYGLTGKQLE